MPSRYCVIVDTAEKRPLPRITHLPLATPTGTRTVQIEWRRKALNTGDYALSGHESGHVFERKGSISELYDNLLTADRLRFLREIHRARSLRRFTILVEQDPATLSTVPPFRKGVSPVRARDALVRLLLAYPWIDLWMFSGKTPTQRRAISEWMVSALILSSEHVDGSPHNHQPV